MRDIREIYPPAKDGTFGGWESDYQPLLADMGTILLRVDDDMYSGDSRVLFRDDSRIGLMIFGWGSCTGCDALQGCDSYEEVDALRAELVGRIQWFDNPKDALAYVRTHDWEGDYSWSSDETKTFIAAATTLLEGMTADS